MGGGGGGGGGGVEFAICPAAMFVCVTLAIKLLPRASRGSSAKQILGLAVIARGKYRKNNF